MLRIFIYSGLLTQTPLRHRAKRGDAGVSDDGADGAQLIPRAARGAAWCATACWSCCRAERGRGEVAEGRGPQRFIDKTQVDHLVVWQSFKCGLLDVSRTTSARPLAAPSAGPPAVSACTMQESEESSSEESSSEEITWSTLTPMWTKLK